MLGAGRFLSSVPIPAGRFDFGSSGSGSATQSTTWVVPAGVPVINVAATTPSTEAARSGSSYTGGRGGGTGYRNLIPVTAGETLWLGLIGNGRTAGSAATQLIAQLRRVDASGELLFQILGSGAVTGTGAVGFAGAAGVVGASGAGSRGGGAATFTSNGVNGGSSIQGGDGFSTQTGAVVPATSSAGAFKNFGGAPSMVTGDADGLVKQGAGGVISIIHGDGRAYPSTNITG